MKGEREAALEMLIERLRSDIELCERYSVGTVRKLLSMALLESRMELHRISPDELRLLCDLIDPSAAKTTDPASH